MTLFARKQDFSLNIVTLLKIVILQCVLILGQLNRLTAAVNRDVAQTFGEV